MYPLFSKDITKDIITIYINMLNVYTDAHQDIDQEIEKTSPFVYAVYDSCLGDTDFGQDVAFIEQRVGSDIRDNEDDNGEQYFPTLSKAKLYVRARFKSGAEYFSLHQSYSPNNLIYIIRDKISYFLA